MKRSVTLRKREKAFVIACLVLLLLLSLYLLSDLMLGSLVRAEGRPVIGKAVFITNEVRRRPPSGDAWEPLAQGGDLFEKDTVESGTASTAGILLTDGTLFDLCADSTATFDRSGRDILIGLVKGCGDVRRTGGAIDRGKRVVLADGNRRIELDEGDLSVRKGPGKAPELFVRSGTADVEVNGRRLTLKPGERAVINDTAVSVERNLFALRAPANGARLFTTGGGTELEFTWDYTGEVAGESPYTLEVSGNRNFSSTVKRVSQRGTTAGLTLPVGSYYWRVSATDPHTTKTDISEPCRLSILKDDPIVLLNPPDGEVLDYTSERPSLYFSWEPHRIASSYRLEISETADFSGNIKKIDTRVVNVTYRWEKDFAPARVGTYYWRVSAGQEQPDWQGRTSTARSFSIQKIRNITPPQLVSPRDNKKICRPCAEREKVIFSWERTEGTLRKTISFSKDKNFGTVYAEFPADLNYWTMASAFPAGTYYWRVGLSDKASPKTVYSGVRSFTMRNFEDIALVSPEDDAAFETGEEGARVGFSWKKPPEARGKYVVELSGKKDFATVGDRIHTSTTDVTARDISPGTYYWRVKMVDDRNSVLAESDARAFNVEEGLKAPVIISPRSGKRVDMSNEDELKFLWKPSRGANSYLLELHQIVSDRTRSRDRLVASTQTPDVRYSVTDMNLLDVGSFYWTIKAVQKNREGRVVRVSRKIKNDFRIGVLGGSKVIVISPKIQVIEDENRKK
jgi:hypothetical protein